MSVILKLNRAVIFYADKAVVDQRLFSNLICVPFWEGGVN